MRARAVTLLALRAAAWELFLLVAYRSIRPEFEAAFRLVAGLLFDLAGLGGAVAFHAGARAPRCDTTAAIDVEACTIWWYAAVDTWFLAYAALRLGLPIAKGFVDHVPQCGAEHAKLWTAGAGRELILAAHATLHQETAICAFVPVLAWVAACRPERLRAAASGPRHS